MLLCMSVCMCVRDIIIIFSLHTCCCIYLTADVNPACHNFFFSSEKKKSNSDWFLLFTKFISLAFFFLFSFWSFQSFQNSQNNYINLNILRWVCCHLQIPKIRPNSQTTLSLTGSSSIFLIVNARVPRYLSACAFSTERRWPLPLLNQLLRLFDLLSGDMQDSRSVGPRSIFTIWWM